MTPEDLRAAVAAGILTEAQAASVQAMAQDRAGKRAAPALVNTVALTLFNIGGTAGMASMAVALTAIALLALVIDRRSFLTAGIVYIALVIAWVIQGGGDGDFGQWVVIILILGATITALGTWWVPLRAAVMRALPAFPGKTSLPPYASAS